MGLVHAPVSTVMLYQPVPLLKRPLVQEHLQERHC
jgi:hypothetical protein